MTSPLFRSWNRHREVQGGDLIPAKAEKDVLSSSLLQCVSPLPVFFSLCESHDSLPVDSHFLVSVPCLKWGYLRVNGRLVTISSVPWNP